MIFKVDYDFKQGVVSFNNGEQFNIESIRRYIVNFHPEAIKPFFIKAIRAKGKNFFSYDYDGFFNSIDQAFLRQYKKYLSSCYDDNIMPVEGITLKDEHLDLIFECVKRQFIIDQHDFKLLNGRLSREEGKSSGYPLMVFIGVADMHGFEAPKISEWAQVDNPSRFTNLLEEFISSIKEKNRIYTKTLLVLNDLRGKMDKYVDLGDLGS